MNVAQLLYKLPIIIDIEVVITLLPEVLGVKDQPSRYTLVLVISTHRPAFAVGAH